MGRKEAMIKRAQALIAAQDEKMDWRSKVLREQALFFIDKFVQTEELALVVAHHLRNR